MRGIDLEVRPGEVFAFLGPNGAGKTTTVEILEGYRDRGGGEVVGPRRGPAARRPRLARADRHRPSGLPPRPLPDRARVAGAVRRLLRLAAPGRRGDRAGRARAGKADERDRPALGRPAAPPRRRHGAGRRPRAALPRRADDRLRPQGPPPGLGGDRRPARPRQDGLPHHPLHGRGPAPRRPGRDHRRRRGRRPRHAGGPRRPREPAGDDHLPARRRGGHAGDDDSGQDPERADRRGARPGRGARGARSDGGRASRTSTWS